MLHHAIAHESDLHDVGSGVKKRASCETLEVCWLLEKHFIQILESCFIGGGNVAFESLFQWVKNWGFKEPYKRLSFSRRPLNTCDNDGTNYGQPLPVVSTRPRSHQGDLVL